VIVASLLLILAAVGLLVGGVLAGSNALVIASILVVAVAAIVLVVGVRQAASARDSLDGDPASTDRRRMTSGGSDGAGRAPAGSGAANVDVPSGVSQVTGGVPGDGMVDDANSTATTGELPAVPADDIRPGMGGPGDVTTVTPVVPVGARRTGRSDTEPVGDASAAAMGAAVPDGGRHTLIDDPTVPGIPTQAAARAAVDSDVSRADGEALTGTIEDSAYASAATDDDPPDEPGIEVVSAADAARVARMTDEVLVVDGRPRYHVPGCVHVVTRPSEPLDVSEAVELGFTPCSLCNPDRTLLANTRQA